MKPIVLASFGSLGDLHPYPAIVAGEQETAPSLG
jgi:hypothetical protein